MSKIEKQNEKWNNLDTSTKEGLEYKRWIIKVGKEYIKEKKTQSWFMKFIDFIFGPFDLLGYHIVDEYGKHNLEKE